MVTTIFLLVFYNGLVSGTAGEYTNLSDCETAKSELILTLSTKESYDYNVQYTPVTPTFAACEPQLQENNTDE